MSDMDELKKLKQSMQSKSGNISHMLVGKWVSTSGDQKVEFGSDGIVNFDGWSTFNCNYEIVGNIIKLDQDGENWILIEHLPDLIELQWDSAPMGTHYRRSR